jgi:hypothetical protein
MKCSGLVGTLCEWKACASSVGTVQVNGSGGPSLPGLLGRDTKSTEFLSTAPQNDVCSPHEIDTVQDGRHSKQNTKKNTQRITPYAGVMAVHDIKSFISSPPRMWPPLSQSDALSTDFSPVLRLLASSIPNVHGHRSVSRPFGTSHCFS